VEVGTEYLIVAEALLEQTGLAGRGIVARFLGRDLVAAEYEPLYDPHKYDVTRLDTRTGAILKEPQPDPLTKRGLTYAVIDGDFVTLDDGTGVVHVAPAFGEVDYDAGDFHGLSFVQPVDLQGIIIGNYPFSGKFVKDADPLILDDLKARELLYRSEKIRHTYPFCWRCETPLLYYAKQTWYIRTTAVKESLIAGNNEINWYPEHIKYGRFGDWLENNVDWAFSRERYWGTPLPIWKCESCGHPECVDSVKDLK
ncbi:unnamed protein product, partial [marine sediment metagenome]